MTERNPISTPALPGGLPFDASQIQFTPAGAGAVARTVQSKLRDTYDVQDFYANGVSGPFVDLTGVLDSTIGLQNAFNASNTYGVKIRSPGGTIKITAPIVLPLQYWFLGPGNRELTISQVTANTSGFTSGSTGGLSQNHTLLKGFTVQGAGIGAGTSIGISLGLATKTCIDCKIDDVTVNSFGLKGVELINHTNAKVSRLYTYGNGTYGLATLGDLSIAGTNAFNEFDLVWSYNHTVNVFCSIMTESVLRRLYLYQDAAFATNTHMLWLQNCLLNRVIYADIQPQAVAVTNAVDPSNSTASVLIESTAGFANDTVGNVIEKSIFGLAGGFSNDAIQLGTSGGKTVYQSQILGNDFISLTGGKSHVNMLNESVSRVLENRSRLATWSTTISDIVLSNPNVATNNSEVDLLQPWTAAMASGGGTITIDPTQKTGTFLRKGHQVTITGGFNVSAVNAPTGDWTITGLPYACKTGVQYDTPVYIWIDGMINTATTEIEARIDNGTSVILIRKFAAGAATACAPSVQVNTLVKINATYFI